MKKTVWIEVPFEVEFDYQPEEPAINDVNSSLLSPGYPSTLCIGSMEFEGIDVNNCFTAKDIEAIEEQLKGFHEDEYETDFPCWNASYPGVNR